jgi:hypothetical protein
VGLYTDASKLKWIFWTSHHSVLLIDMLFKSSRNLSTRKNGILGLQIRNIQGMINTTLTNSFLKTSLSHKKRRVKGRRRRIPENGAIFTKASGGFAKDEISVSASNVDCHTTSNPLRMRYYVMFPHWMSVMFSWANHICGSAMLFMSLDPVASLLLWGVISTEYQR